MTLVESLNLGFAIMAAGFSFSAMAHARNALTEAKCGRIAAEHAEKHAQYVHVSDVPDLAAQVSDLTDTVELSLKALPKSRSKRAPKAQ